MRCFPGAKLPEEADWTYEINLHGYRARAIRDSSDLQLLSPGQEDTGIHLPALIAGLPMRCVRLRLLMVRRRLSG